MNTLADQASKLDTKTLQSCYARPPEVSGVTPAQVRTVCKDELVKRGDCVPLLKGELEALFDSHRAAGLAPIAVLGPDTGHQHAGKAPKRAGWQRYDSVSERALLQDGDNIGWLGGFRCDDASIFVGVDIDFDNEEATRAALSAACFADQPVRYGRPKRALVPVKMPAGTASQDVAWKRKNPETGKTETIKLQVISVGRQFVACGIHPDERKAYRWEQLAGKSIAEWPVITLPDMLAQLDAKLQPLGFVRLAKGVARASPEECKLPDDLTEQERIALQWWGASEFGHGLKELNNRGKGQKRGTVAYATCATIAPLVWAGLVDQTDLEDQIYDIHPDLSEDRDVTNGFKAGNLKAVALLARLRGETSSLAAAETETEELKTAQEIAKEMWETKRKTAHVIHTDNHPRMTATHAAAAFCQANSRLLFRSTANGEIVTVEVKGAPAEVLEAAAGLHPIARPPEVYPQEVKVSDTKLFSLYNESVHLWRAIDYPEHLGGVPSGEEEVTWEEMHGTGTRARTVIITAKTLAWGLKRASNPDVLLGLDPSRKVLVPHLLDKVNNKLAHELIKDGTNDAYLWRLTSIHCAPQFTKDGRVLTVDGFHGDGEGGGCMIALGQLNGLVHAGVPLDEAKATVREFIAPFPYSGPDDEAVLICLLFATLSRGAFPLAPLFIFDAPRSGTGKTLAVVIISKIAGAVAPVIIPCADGSKDGEAELRKRIETALVTGASGVVLLDDVPRSRVPNPETLRTALSEPTPLMVRKFGKNDEQVPTDPTRIIWTVTGINVGVSDDMVRRCISCYLDRLEAEKRGWDQQHAFAELRRIVDDPAARAKLLSAALSILQRNWRERPCRTRDTENYEGWSQVVREAVMFTTGADPWATNVRLAGDDTRAEEHSEVCAALFDITKGEKVELSHIVAAVMQSGPLFESPVTAVPEGVQVIRRIFQCKDANELYARLGGFLKRHKNKPSFGDPRLVIRQRKPETKRAKALWWIEALDAVPAAFPWQSKQDAAE